MAQDVAQDVAEDVLGAAEDGSVKVFIVARAIFQRRNPRPHTHAATYAALRRHVKDEHVKDAAQGVAEDVTQDVAEEVLGAAEDGSVKVFVVARAIFQRWNPRPTQACRPHASPWATREGGIKPD